jgi:hypothetical protein
VVHHFMNVEGEGRRFDPWEVMHRFSIFQWYIL